MVRRRDLAGVGVNPLLELLAALPLWFRHGLITVLGLVTLVCPLLLWTAWSKTVFWAVIAAACGSILLIWLLLYASPEDDF